MRIAFKKYLACISLVLICGEVLSQPINRKQLVERHTIVNTRVDTLSSLSVGNGSFAFTVDVTGLQSFPDAYAKGVPLGTQSEWGWHSFPDTENYKFEDALRSYHLNGRNVPYAVQWNSPAQNKNASDYFRQNLHRLHLANIGLEIRKNDGTLYTIADVKNIHQTLNMWMGEIHSSFTVEGKTVEVTTFCDQQVDAIGIKIKSDLIAENRLAIRLRLPYPNGNWADVGNNWKDEHKHQSSFAPTAENAALIQHVLDTTTYYIGTTWKGAASIDRKSAHHYTVTPSTNEFELSVRFDAKKNSVPVPSYDMISDNSKQKWVGFWQSGGAVDFTGSKDARANELERRIVLSQYLTKIQCAGNNPPQETGLTYNSWYGKPHMEMHWWHAVHFALWGRTELMEKSLDWYKRNAAGAKEIAGRQGYQGVRWQKMTDNDGRESPSSVGAFLIWQQPHFIYFTELMYRSTLANSTLDKYKNLVFATADFMASYAYYDSTLKRYILGKGVIAAQERFKPEETFNPAYELVYWRWALETAQQWRMRLKLPRNKKWDEVLLKLSPLAMQDGKYLFAESATDSYTNPEYETDHPSVFGALGMLPKTKMVETAVMQKTFDWVWENWTWEKTWGWDYPMTAMTAARLAMPEKAIDALLMPVQKNTYLPNGHNYQEDRLTIYLPGNGGLLAAIAMMCAGWDGSKNVNPGIPNNENWKVKWEGLKRMP